MATRPGPSTRATRQAYYNQMADHSESPSSADHSAAVHPSVFQQQPSIARSGSFPQHNSAVSRGMPRRSLPNHVPPQMAPPPMNHSAFARQDPHASRPHWSSSHPPHLGPRPQARPHAHAHAHPQMHHAQRLYDLSDASERFYAPQSAPLAPLRRAPSTSSRSSEVAPSPTDRCHTIQPTGSSGFASLLRSSSLPRPPPPSPPARTTAAATTKPRGRARSSPYLTEADRQDIMTRIRRGEKQADLAKEYHVSRAAITNLKQRRQMLEMIENNKNAKLGHTAVDVDTPKSTEMATSDPASSVSASTPPKRRKLAHNSQTDTSTTEAVDEDVASMSSRATLSPTGSSRSHGSPRTAVDPDVNVDAVTAGKVNMSARHHEVTTPTMTRLLTSLLDPKTSDEVFRATMQRTHRLLLEEAIGWSYSHGGGSVSAEAFKPVALVSGSVEAPRLAHEYHIMEPLTPVSSVCDLAQRSDDHHVDVSVRLPTAVLSRSPVVLFLDDIRSSTPSTPSTVSTASTTKDSAQQAIARCLLVLQTLLLHGVDEDRIFLVLSLCDAKLAAALRRQFPDVHVVAARLLTDREPVKEQTLLRGYHDRLAALAPAEEAVHRVDISVSTPTNVVTTKASE